MKGRKGVSTIPFRLFLFSLFVPAGFLLKKVMVKNYAEKILAECIGEELPPCQTACPLDIRVREKLARMQAGDMAGALAVLLERCPFPGILGRICHHPCETACTRNKVDEPIAIAALKRFVSDLDPAAGPVWEPGSARPERVAVVGGGPAGLMCACELRRLGYQVTLFEAEDTLGGALRLYLPAYRLPREVLNREVSLAAKLGAEVRLNTRVGRDISWEELRARFQAVFVATGAHRSLSLGVPGEDLAGVTDALSFLKAANQGTPLSPVRSAAVIGGGNVAVDAARTAHRLGAANVTLICLETPEEMPARPREVREAAAEGVAVRHRWGVAALLGESGQVAGLKLKAVVRAFDDQGRLAPVYDETRLAEQPADLVIIAVGQAAADDFPGPGPLAVDPKTLATALPGVFAGGDAVTGPKSAVAAFAAGRRAALAIDAYLQGKPLPADLPPLESRTTDLLVNLEGVSPAPRATMPQLTPEERLADPTAEVESGLPAEAAAKEAARCLSCVCSECVKNCTFLQTYVGHFPYTEKELVRILEARGAAEPQIPYSCHYCGLCQAVCPQDLHAGEACLELRRRLVAAGRGPLPRHRGIQNYVKWGTSATFTLTRPDPNTGKAARIFFPGCSLAGYSPHLVKAAYGYLVQRLPDTGIMLNCCGAPSRLMGEEPLFQGIVAELAGELARWGTTELIAACTHCLEIFREHLPGLTSRSIYEVLTELGLPEGSQAASGSLFQVHDACGARHMPQVQVAVRLTLELAGHRLEEMPHHGERTICCGAGGMAPAVDAPLAQKMTAFRLSEAQGDLVTYCATCRARFAQAGHPALHLLELLWNPDWQAARTTPPAGSLLRWWRRWWLKRHFQIN
jgi:NADPH-dependent glutamate synthase beta subunit-like oxidoreductase